MPDQARPDDPGEDGGLSTLGDLLRHLTELFRKELRLARAEMSEALTRAAIAIGLLVAAVILFLVALNALAGAAVAGLTLAGLPGWAAALVVGGVLVLIATALTFAGLRNLKARRLAPTRTVENIRTDARTLKESLTDG